MKLIKESVLVFGIGGLLLASSCANESPWSTADRADGKIRLTLLTDGRVNEGTRADNEVNIEPNPNEFTINLTSSDGSYKKSWPSLESFNKEEGFPMGNYILSASFGSLEEEGFTNPYFYGQTPVEVSIGKEKPVTITASLANSMVSVRYTDQLKNVFKNYSATTQTEGYKQMIFVQDEARPAYIVPGKVSMTVTLTREGYESQQFSVGTFQANPKTHVIATIGIEGDLTSDSALLTVEFTENVESEIVNVTLSEETFTAPKPEVRGEGFEESNGIETTEAVLKEELNPEFHIFAQKGIKEVTLNISANDSGVLPSFGNSIVLTDPSNQTAIENSGLECYGLSGKLGEMAVINFKNFIRNLAVGEYDITAQVTDDLDRKNDSEQTIHLKVKVTSLDITIQNVETLEFMSSKIKLSVATNSDLIKDKIQFQSKGENVTGKLVGESIEPGSGLFLYTYELTVPNINDCIWKVWAGLSQSKYDEKEFEVKMPEFTMTADPFAQYVKIKINESDQAKLKLIFDNAQVIQYNSNGSHSEVKSSSIQKDLESGIITISGLTQNTDYDFGLFLGNTWTNNYSGTRCETFRTEIEEGVPNGDFENLSQEYKGKANQGGRWTATLIRDYRQNTVSYSFKEPAMWATTNAKTMNGKTEFTTDDNSWFIQPSVFNSGIDYVSNNVGIPGSGSGNSTPQSFRDFKPYSNDNAMVIRNVGWDSNKNNIPDDVKTTGQNGYYNRNVPAINYKSVGKMFLGKYTISGMNETYDKGVEFSSRPSKLTGYYIYTKDRDSNQEDNGVVTVIVYNDSEVIAYGSTDLEACVNYSLFEVPLEYKQFGKNATKICIMVESSKYGSESIEDETSKLRVSNYNSRYESFQHGATLVVDNFEFSYE